MTCPTCHTKTRIIDSREKRPGQRWRRHLCQNNHKFSTLETFEKFLQQHICAATGLRSYALGTVVIKDGDPFKCEACGRWHLTPPKKTTIPTEQE